MSEYVQVQTAVPSREEGMRIARSAVEARLAACAQVVGPITSTYRWKGAVHVDEEYLLLLKTPASRYADLEKNIHEQHSYDVAEIISVPVNAGLRAYLTWMDEETKAPDA
ncbi:divalent-cation tolerance protein CutA [Actinomadura alba]|uniref:Divalent-cation tolerance protein CutA n=1 Tax=Actinomadura alba TaxID=406431 RepID=A0ABR7LPH5_9ACTN|nr:divalent-cation tolerance protein CutA [Actinomadura alba]MBC6466661.1 divalent-cation tolerance protein CutA [Actinomadura alba]